MQFNRQLFDDKLPIVGTAILISPTEYLVLRVIFNNFDFNSPTMPDLPSKNNLLFRLKSFQLITSTKIDPNTMEQLAHFICGPV